VAVGIVQQGQDPADAGEVHAAVILALRGEPGGPLIDGRLAGTPMAK
jgi:hypothetical protein